MEFDCFDKKHGTEVLDYLFQRFSEEDARDVICGDGHIKVIEIEEGHSEEIEYKTAFRLWWEKQKEGNRKFVERVEKAKARKP